MREHTWRIWSKEKLSMSYSHGLPLHLASEEREQNVYMQYTEVKDSNGIKACEGDIIALYVEDEYTANRDTGGGIIDYDKIEGYKQLGVVEFNSCSYTYKTAKTISGKHEEINIPVDWLDNFEIVGNIFENRFLLSV